MVRVGHPLTLMVVGMLLAACGDESSDGGPMSATEAGMGDEVADGGADADVGSVIVDACVPVAEVCNGIDDDCDGLGDESLMPPAADRTEGICGLFFKQCTGPDGWQEPNYGVSPEYQDVEDRCDGQDNDCDGIVDENVSPPPASLTEGVCQGLTQVCAGIPGFEEPDFASIMHYEVVESLCDGLDNDCDGIVDERLAECSP